MSLSIYDASVPVLLTGFDNLSHVLRKGEEFATATGVDPATLVTARLAPDMHPLKNQVQIASDTAKGAGARLAGVDNPRFADEEASFADLQERIAKTQAFLKELRRDAFDGAEDREIGMRLGGGERVMSGRSYLFGFVLPNFFFHLTTAYAILRHSGVPLGKADYLRAGRA